MDPQLLQHVRREAPCPLLGGLSREEAERMLLSQQPLPGLNMTEKHFEDYQNCVCDFCVPLLRSADECLACDRRLEDPSDVLCPTCELYVKDEGLCGHCWGLLSDGRCTRPRQE